MQRGLVSIVLILVTGLILISYMPARWPVERVTKAVIAEQVANRPSPSVVQSETTQDVHLEGLLSSSSECVCTSVGPTAGSVCVRLADGTCGVVRVPKEPKPKPENSTPDLEIADPGISYSISKPIVVVSDATPLDLQMNARGALIVQLYCKAKPDDDWMPCDGANLNPDENGNFTRIYMGETSDGNRFRIAPIGKE